MVFADKTGYGEAAKVEVDYSEHAKNFAFRAFTYEKIGDKMDWKRVNVDPSIARFTVQFMHRPDGNNYFHTWEEIPIKNCTDADFANFKPARADYEARIGNMMKNYSLNCLDLDNFNKPLILKGSNDADSVDFL